MVDPPWARRQGVAPVVEEWLSSGKVRPCLAAHEFLEASEADYAPVPPNLPPPLTRALSQRGIDRLYSHQAKAILAALSGRHVVVATPTASGKSLCFHLPVVHGLF
jgi:DEAD/DEAH box helicase domain-containing protein